MDSIAKAIAVNVVVTLGSYFIARTIIRRIEGHERQRHAER